MMFEFDELEEKCLVDNGEAILNKKAVYEPSKGQRFRQVVCTRTWALCILVSMAVVVVAVALIAAFARPAAPQCADETTQLSVQDPTSKTPGSGSHPAQTYIASNGQPFPWKNLRLPTSVLPEEYHIKLHTNLTQKEFRGSVRMKLRVATPTDFVVFNTEALNISGLSISVDGEKSASSSEASAVPDNKLRVLRELEYPGNQQYYVQLSLTLLAGTSVTLSVSFEGSLEDLNDMMGYYRSAYTVNGKERFMASTQFEAMGARKAFPCLDEPQLKAKFYMTMVRDAAHITLFNTPRQGQMTRQDGLIEDEYKPTKMMSTYLVAYVVCDFKSISKTTNDGIEVRMFASEDKIYMGQYALDSAVTVLEYYNQFFGIAYPLPKLDLIAIPNFAAGAMENWGLVTYRESAILYDPNISSSAAKQWVATVVAHELAHQWFGNLVTFKWWTDLWLNEGFASYVENIGADQVDAEFHKMEHFGSWSRALYRDSFPASHPIEVDIQTASDVSGAFDPISYDKAASLIRMLVDTVGAENFHQSLREYLQKFAYSNAETNDLWDAFQKTGNIPAGLSVSKVMDTWTKQMGYPVVTVARQQGKITLTQQRFLLAQPLETAEPARYTSPYNYTWQIPFTYTTASDSQTHQLVWMQQGNATVELPDASTAWVKGNTGSKGYYRVNYDEAGWRALGQQLQEDITVFSSAERHGLINDAFSLARAGMLNYSIALDLISYLDKEPSYFVWRTAISHLNFLIDRIFLTQEYDKLKAYIWSLARSHYEAVGWTEGGTYLERKMQSFMVSLALACEFQPAIDKALKFFKQWKANINTSLNNDLRGLIYSTGVRYGTKADWDVVLARYKTEANPSEKEELLAALAQPRDARTLQILLELSLTEIKSQDTGTAITSVAGNRNGHLLAWHFVREHWDKLFHLYGEQMFLLSSMISGVISPFNTQFDYQEVSSFFSTRDVGSATLKLQQSLEVVANNWHWALDHEAGVQTWLRELQIPQ